MYHPEPREGSFVIKQFRFFTTLRYVQHDGKRDFFNSLLRVDPVTPEVHLSVMTVFVRIGVPALLLKSGSRQLLF